MRHYYNLLVISLILCVQVYAEADMFPSPLIGEYCSANNDCKLNNSLCFDQKCHCKLNYLPIGRYECSLPYLGMPCTDDDFCKIHINQTICSADKKCECNIYSYPANNQEYGLSLINSPRQKCKTKNSLCIENRCYYHSTTDFTEKFCFNDNECYGSLLDGFCDIDKDCLAYNSACIGGKCACKLNYRNNSMYECTPSKLHLYCRIDDHCSAIPNAECFDYECSCKSGYSELNFTTCSSLLGTNCTSTAECAVEYSVCSNGKCECPDFYVQQSDDRCLPRVSNNTCEDDTDCKRIKFSYCSDNKVCACKKNFIVMNSRMCGAPLGEFCTIYRPCVIENSLCVDNKCQCKPFFVKTSTSQCLPTRLEESCNNNKDCKMIKNGICSLSKKCICRNNYSALSAGVCPSLVNGNCEEDEDCYVINSVCVVNKCQCKTNYVAVDADSRCQSITLGQKCFNHGDCSLIPNSVCSPNGRCICRSYYFAQSNLLCSPTINSYCPNNQDCQSPSFHCVNHKCQCKPGLIAMSVDKCVEAHSLYSCKDKTECSDSWHWKCSPAGKCVCNEKNIPITNSTCLPILGGFCWRNDQCIAGNSECNDFNCKCKPDFVKVADNLCVSSS